MFYSHEIRAIAARAAMKLSYRRSTVASKLARSPACCMAAVGLSEQEMSKEIEEMENLQADQNSRLIKISYVNSYHRGKRSPCHFKFV
ncbi:hypothetical protein BGAL_0306g00030 [Botrytis galanthina]|uniref:Uncharacterized protein n=1 Tax=Botrytis galanthina TaxID=278940 RepID=A0A4S8QR74_9HELO|nr:hypothetical protein BGAL_0306g00030 [Botrytis galanthina]